MHGHQSCCTEHLYSVCLIRTHQLGRQITEALGYCGKGPKVQKNGWALQLNRFKVKTKSPSQVHLGLTHPSFWVGRTRRGFRPAVRSWNRSYYLRSRSWSSSSRSRSGYAFVSVLRCLALTSFSSLALAHIPCLSLKDFFF